MLDGTKLQQYLQQGNVGITFDTSVVVRGGFYDICDQVNEINEQGRPGWAPLKLFIPAVAYTERLFSLRRKHANNFDDSELQEALSNRNVKVIPFTKEDAEFCANLLGERYRDRETWWDFKKHRCIECVGLLQYTAKAKGTGAKCGTPNDWLIAAQGCSKNRLLVMDDKGRPGEFEKFQYRTNSQTLEETLQTLLQVAS